MFAVGAGIVAFEYDRQQRKEAAKRGAEAAEKRRAAEHAREERERALRDNRAQTAAIEGLAARMSALEEGLPLRIKEAIDAHHAQRQGGMFKGFLGLS